MPLSFDLAPFQILGQKFVKFFVGILVQTMTPKGHFEINWPLVGSKCQTFVLFVFKEEKLSSLLQNTGSVDTEFLSIWLWSAQMLRKIKTSTWFLCKIIGIISNNLSFYSLLLFTSMGHYRIVKPCRLRVLLSFLSDHVR